MLCTGGSRPKVERVLAVCVQRCTLVSGTGNGVWRIPQYNSDPSRHLGMILV